VEGGSPVIKAASYEDVEVLEEGLEEGLGAPSHQDNIVDSKVD